MDEQQVEQAAERLEQLLETLKANGVPSSRDALVALLEEKLGQDWERILHDARVLRPVHMNCPKLLYLLLILHGAKFVSYWLEGMVPGLADKATEMLRKMFAYDSSQPLSKPFIEVWKSIPVQAKLDLIRCVFDEYPGEPFRSWREFGRDLRHLICEMHYLRHEYRSSRAVYLPYFPAGLSFPCSGYVPDVRVERLLDVVRAAGDKESEQVILRMIDERKKACSVISASQATLYTPNRDERELIARLLANTDRAGYRPAPLPKITMSFEPPPLFVAHPELEEEADEPTGQRGRDEEFDEERRAPRVPRGQRPWPEVISIEELLGVYHPAPEPGIVLYARGIAWCARRHDFDEDVLRAVVLIHECGHWATHMLPKPGIPPWPTETFLLTEEAVHEGWAQLMTWWVVNEVGGPFEQTFEELNIRQPEAYRVYGAFESSDRKTVMNSLQYLRLQMRPATFDGWKSLVGA